MKDLREILSEYWGYASFRPKQEEIMKEAVAGHDVLAIMPTGGGKSLCYQVPSMAIDGIAIVVSPLIALMKDQVQSLQRRGIKAVSVHSGMSPQEIDAALDNAVYGDYKFLYVSPERLKTRIFRERVRKMDVNFIVVDEAHCISQWGYDFRPDYLDIITLREILTEKVPVIAVTATATPAVADDIMSRLGFPVKNIIVSGFERPNLSYVVRKVEDKLGNMMRILDGVPGSGIIYVRQRKRAEEISAFLRTKGISADYYHAGLSAELRNLKQDAWVNGKTRIMVATNAFGMGIDKPDVRTVVHYDLPESIEAYFQEAGRAGRDGLRSYAVLLAANADRANLKRFLPVAFPDIDYIADIYQKVFKYLGIPYESGAGETYKFEIFPFAEHFGLQQAKAYYAVKYIAREGYWTLTDEIDNPSRVVFSVSRDELYKVQLASEDKDSFIRTLLRLYPGIFSSMVRIDEEFIAAKHRCSVQAVKNFLISLSRDHVVRYIPKTRSPLLILNNERLLESNFYIDRKRYDKLRNAYSDRLDAMLAYAGNDDECRAVALSGYFGRKVAECGCCDVCLKKRNSKNPDAVRARIMNAVREGGGRISIAELQLELERQIPEVLVEVRNMADSGVLRIENGSYIAAVGEDASSTR